ncbi:hypothetical protein BJX61DRAFT_543889 [Aspergillus egyptiacus]|nr:hypothetical protein BJX61DRAFT_543889 [Aspergillus egyptiacus]
MPSASTWTTFLPILLSILILSPYTTSHPLPHPLPEPEQSIPHPGRPAGTLRPRSPIPIPIPVPVPNPRMIPSQTDFLSYMFAKLGMEELEKFNKQPRPEDQGHEDPAMIGESQSTTTITVTSHGNKTSAEEGSVGEEVVGDPKGFMETLFDALRRKFREVLNSSDEITLRQRKG